MTPGRLDLEVPRNGSDQRTLALMTLDDAGAEVPIDLTDYLVSANARDVFGGAVVATATVTISDAAAGEVNMTWLGSDFDAFGGPFADSIAAYDLRAEGDDGIPVVVLRGLLHITPEATA